MPRNSLAVPVLVLLGIVLVLGACSGGNGGPGGGAGGGGAASAVVGPAGGQVTSADGRLTLDVPAGALATMETITITALTAAQLDPVVAAAGPALAYRLEPDGLQFALPVSVCVDAGAPVQNGPGDFQVGYVALVSQSSAGFEELTCGMAVDLAAGSATVEGALQHFSNLLVLGRTTDEEIYFGITVPPVLTGGSGTLTGMVVQKASSSVTSGAITWDADSGAGLTSDIESPTVFDALGLLTVTAQTLTRTATLTCQTPGPKNLDVEFVLETFDIGGLLPGLVGASNAQRIFFSAATTCPGAPQPSLYQVAAITAIEAVRVISPPAGCGAGPALLVAGTGGANIMDPVTGAVLQSITPPGVGVFFDALFFPKPAGQPDHGLFLSGNDVRMDRLDDQCNTGGFAQTSLNSNLDATYAAGDPMLGGHAAGPGMLTEIVFDPASQGWVFQDSGIPASLLPQGFRSVQGNATGDRFLAVGDTGVTFIDNSGTTPTAQLSFALGSNPRRIRWDPVSGFGAISDLGDDSITVFTWDGVNPPVLTDIVFVGDGPVGVDVLGNRIACAGFDDDTYSIIELDANGMATSVSVTPSPFTTGGSSPGHAVFLGDAAHSVVISFNGDDVIGVIPNAY